MTQVKKTEFVSSEVIPTKKYKVGSYQTIGDKLYRKDKTGKLIRVYEPRINTAPYRTKRIKALEKREEVRAGIAYIITCILILGGYAVFSAHNNIVLDVEAQGATSEDVIVKDVAPISYAGIPFIEEVKAEETEIKTEKEQIRQVATKYCAEKGLDNSCVVDTMAIAWNESRFDVTANGDNGDSWGCFQINRRSNAHPEVSIKNAKDIEFSTKWTIDNLVNNGYPTYRSYAIRRHNGDPTIKQTAVYLQKINKYISTNNS